MRFERQFVLGKDARRKIRIRQDTSCARHVHGHDAKLVTAAEMPHRGEKRLPERSHGVITLAASPGHVPQHIHHFGYVDVVGTAGCARRARHAQPQGSGGKGRLSVAELDGAHDLVDLHVVLRTAGTAGRAVAALVTEGKVLAAFLLHLAQEGFVARGSEIECIHDAPGRMMVHGHATPQFRPLPRRSKELFRARRVAMVQKSCFFRRVGEENRKRHAAVCCFLAKIIRFSQKSKGGPLLAASLEEAIF